MSARLISRSADLSRLKDEGYELEIRDGLLHVHHVPYITPARRVAFGTLISTLNLAGDETARPETHAISFSGEAPCDKDGRRLERIIIGGLHQPGPGVEADHQFSSKPPQGYANYYEKMTTYVLILSGPARALDREVTARTYGPIRDSDPDSVFEYMDTASSRAGIGVATEKLRVGKVAIVGLGGTGSYVLDLLAKTPIAEIHLFDGDVLLTHNAFRSPGAPSLDELRQRPMKVDHFHAIYSKMRRGIVAHPCYVDESNIGELREMDFVFICIDDGPPRQPIVENLCQWGKSFTDVGMGASEQDGSIGALVRVTTSTPDQRDHLGNRLTFGSGPDNDYRRNVQVADLNALNATLAVIRWKKTVGFYSDLEHEHNCIYEVDGNTILNEDHA
jgi:molybdopterin/thiamine biosynthesis adenylyltransferase